MARARIQLRYDKTTGRYELVVDMEQESLDLRRHNQRHEQLVRDFAGDAPIEEAGGAGGDARPAQAQPVKPAGRLQEQ